jgi:hypothetical protein
MTGDNRMDTHGAAVGRMAAVTGALVLTGRPAPFGLAR